MKRRKGRRRRRRRRRRRTQIILGHRASRDIRLLRRHLAAHPHQASGTAVKVVGVPRPRQYTTPSNSSSSRRGTATGHTGVRWVLVGVNGRV